MGSKTRKFARSAFHRVDLHAKTRVACLNQPLSSPQLPLSFSFPPPLSLNLVVRFGAHHRPDGVSGRQGPRDLLQEASSFHWYACFFFLFSSFLFFFFGRGGGGVVVLFWGCARLHARVKGHLHCGGISSPPLLLVVLLGCLSTSSTHGN